MYNRTKKIAKKLLPEKFLFHNEELIRSLLKPFYRGSNYFCNVCGTHLKQFAKLSDAAEICPVCGSLPRTRRLFKLLNDAYLQDGMAVLDFSPSRSIYRQMKKRKGIQYFATDFENQFMADYRFDITALNLPNEKFDLIICYHILEHILDDRRAIQELHRVLKKDGVLLVQTPFKKGKIFENHNIKSREDRLHHFGQEDHVRIYSVSGLCGRLQNQGFFTDAIQFEADNHLKLNANETVIICRKQF